MAYEDAPVEPVIWGAYGPCRTQAQADVSLAEYVAEQEFLRPRDEDWDAKGISTDQLPETW